MRELALYKNCIIIIIIIIILILIMVFAVSLVDSIHIITCDLPV